MRPTIPALFAAAVFATLFLGCPHTETSPTFVRVPDSDLCPAMCEHIGPKGLNCDEGKDYYDNDKPGPKGVPNATCLEFCQRQQENGVYENPRCLTQVPACALIEEWRKKDCTAVDGGK
jgi:hypothetical protein